MAATHPTRDRFSRKLADGTTVVQVGPYWLEEGLAKRWRAFCSVTCNSDQTKVFTRIVEKALKGEVKIDGL